MLVTTKHVNNKGLKLVDATGRDIKLAILSFDTETNEAEFFITVQGTHGDKASRIANSSKTEDNEKVSFEPMKVKAVLKGAQMMIKHKGSDFYTEFKGVKSYCDGCTRCGLPCGRNTI